MDYFEVTVKHGGTEWKLLEKAMSDTIASYHRNTTMNHKVKFSDLEVADLNMFVDIGYLLIKICVPGNADHESPKPIAVAQV